MVKYTCDDEMKVLQSIDKFVKLISNPPEPNRYYFNQDGWTAEQIGKDYNFQIKVTLTGAAQNIDLILPFDCTINRIEYFSNDATAKSFTTQIFSGAVDVTSYDQLLSIVADINQPIAYVPSGDEGKYMQSPIRFRTAVSASTAGKTLTIKIQIKRL